MHRQKKQEDKGMREASQVNAFYALISLLMLPAALLLFFGIRNWYFGIQDSNEEKRKWGKLSTMFGIIFIMILAVCSYFLKGTLFE